MTRLGRLLEELLGPEPPVAVRAYDGTDMGPPDAKVTIVIRSPDALRRILTRPGELGFARAYVAGDIDLEGDIFELFRLQQRIPRPRLTPGQIARLALDNEVLVYELTPKVSSLEDAYFDLTKDEVEYHSHLTGGPAGAQPAAAPATAGK